jgi:histidinol dehydrogenase
LSEINLFELDRLSAAEREALMTRTEADLSGYLGPVQEIIDAVRAEGDTAVARFGRAFDKADVHADRLMATPEEFDQAFAATPPELREAIEFAVENIRTFHEAQKPESMWGATA